MNLTLEAFGATTPQTNASAVRVVAAEYPVNFDEFGERIDFSLSAIASIAAAPTQPALIEAWASAGENDASGTGTLLGSLTLPTGAIAAPTAFYGFLQIVNPGGQKYVTFTTRGGLSGAAPVTLSFRGLLLALDGPDGDSCNVATTPLVQLRAGAKELADKVNDASVSDDTWDGWINQGVESLWSIVATAFADHFFKTVDFTLAGGVGGNIYDVTTIPAGDFRRVRFLEVFPDTNQRRRVRGFNFNEKDATTGGIGAGTWCNVRRYRLMGQKLYVEPYEQAAATYRLYYVPKPSVLALRCDALDPAVDEWAEYPMIFAAMKALGKEESDTGPLGVRLAELKAEILDAAATRDDGEADTIADVESMDGGFNGRWRT